MRGRVARALAAALFLLVLVLAALLVALAARPAAAWGGGDGPPSAAPLPPLRFTRYSPALADNKKKWTNPDLMVGTQLAGLFASGRVRTEDGEERRLGSALDPIEGRHLYDLVRLNGVTRTLEVGMANGVSTLYLAQGVRDNLGALGTEGAGAGALGTKIGAKGAPPAGQGGAPGHVAIDPFQRSQWGGAALVNLEKAGLRALVEWVPEKSHAALPRLLAEGRRFQLIFIDGMHLYDYTLVDLFYADLLLEPGGAIVIDDLRLPAVAEVLRYAVTNYPHLKLQTGTLCDSRMATLWKRGEDARSWDFHVELCRSPAPHAGRGPPPFSRPG